MFDLDATKILIVGAAALIFIPPKDLPRVMRQAGQFVGKMKRMASEFQGQFMDAMREADMADLRREAQQLSQSTRVDLGLDQINASMSDQIASHNAKIVAGTPAPPSVTAAPEPPARTAANDAPLALVAAPVDQPPASETPAAAPPPGTPASHHPVAEPAPHQAA